MSKAAADVPTRHPAPAVPTVQGPPRPMQAVSQSRNSHEEAGCERRNGPVYLPDSAPDPAPGKRRRPGFQLSNAGWHRLDDPLPRHLVLRQVRRRPLDLNLGSPAVSTLTSRHAARRQPRARVNGGAGKEGCGLPRAGTGTPGSGGAAGERRPKARRGSGRPACPGAERARSPGRPGSPGAFLPGPAHLGSGLGPLPPAPGHLAAYLVPPRGATDRPASVPAPRPARSAGSAGLGATASPWRPGGGGGGALAAGQTTRQGSPGPEVPSTRPHSSAGPACAGSPTPGRVPDRPRQIPSAAQDADRGAPRPP
jgi:hypothetical protein